MPKIKMTETWLKGKSCRCPEAKPKILFSDSTTQGLLLQVRPNGTKSWLYRYYMGRNSKDVGLGPYPIVNLITARKKAFENQQLRIDGKDPLREKRLAAQQDRKDIPTFKEASETYIRSQEAPDGDYRSLNHSGWKCDRTGPIWRRRLDNHANKFIGFKLVNEIEEIDIRNILQQETHKKATGRSKAMTGQLCNVKYDTAKSIREYIETILDDCRQYRDGLENPAQRKFHKYLGRNKPTQVNQPALDYKRLPNFMKELVGQNGLAARLLEFKILTGLRPGSETVEASWSEIDLACSTWTIPAERMKMKELHVVPLSTQSITLLMSLPRIDKNKFLFPSNRSKAGHIHRDSQLRLLTRMGWRYKITPHGMRRTLREWCAVNGYPWELGETALAHKIGSKASQAYLSDVYVEQRRPMLQAFADYAYSLVE